MNLKEWRISNGIHTHFAPHMAEPWTAWVGNRSASQHYDIHGDRGFEYAETELDAVLKAAKRWDINVPGWLSNG